MTCGFAVGTAPTGASPAGARAAAAEVQEMWAVLLSVMTTSGADSGETSAYVAEQISAYVVHAYPTLAEERMTIAATTGSNSKRAGLT